MALAWAALALLALLATVAPEQAVAQSEVTLVGNAGQPTGERHTASFQGAVDHAQQFATGSNTYGYTLTKVEFLSNDAQSHTFSAQFCEANNTGGDDVPDPMNCQTLSTTSSFAQSSAVVFTPPAGKTITLAASTRYVVVLSENNSPSAEVAILSTQADNQNGATGWTLTNVFDWKQNGTTWMKQGMGRDALIMDVKGYVNTSLPAAVSDVVVVPVRRTTDSLRISWTAPDNTGKPALTGYEFRYKPTIGGTWTLVSHPGASTSVTVNSLEANEYYFVEVRALNADGSGPWSVTAESQTTPLPETVLANHPLIPDDLGPGDSFRLLHVTSGTTAATGTLIPRYHDTAAADVFPLVNSGGLLSRWFEGVRLRQRALVSTAGADARLNTDTTWTSTDLGVPIYWVTGARVADDYQDFYDGTWADEANPVNGLGAPRSLASTAPWTGTSHDGTELLDGGASRAVGQSMVGVGAPNSAVTGTGPLSGGGTFASTEERPLYGLWHVMVIDENFRLAGNLTLASTATEGSDERAAVRAQLFTTGPNPGGYGISYIYHWKGSEDPADASLGAVAIHTTDGDGDPDLVDGLHATLSLESTDDSAAGWTLGAPVGTVLKPSTTYALVFQGADPAYPKLGTTVVDGEDVVAAGWSLADVLRYHDGSNWVDNPDGFALSMDIIGPLVDAPALGAPTGLTATANGTTQIDLSWTAPASDGGSAITGYKIEISSDGGNAWTTHLADTTDANTTYAHTGLAAGTTRHYRVSAINAIGTSAASNVDDATTGTGTNTPPTASNGEVTATEDTDYPFTAANFNFSDTDAGAALSSVKITSLPASGTGTLEVDGTVIASINLPKAVTKVDIDASKLTYSPPADANGDDYAIFQFKVNDGTDDSATASTMTIDVTAVNDAPTVATAIPDQEATAGTAFSYAFPDTTFTDADNDMLTYMATKGDGMALPTWLSFDATTRIFSGTAQAADVGTVPVKVTASDGKGESVSDEFDITVTAAVQLEVTLVGNAGQPTGERQTASFQGAVDHAQQFTTGPAAGDTLTKVEFLSKDAQGHTFSAQLCEANNTGEGAVPDPMNCQTLSTTSSFAQDSVVVFTPPGGMTITLAASTRYVVVLSENNSPSAQVEIFATQADNQSGETGWTLANVFDWKQNGTTWMKQGIGRDALIMDVKGYTLLPPGAVSDVVVVPVPRSTTSLTVSWSAPDNAGKPAITAYDVRYRETDTFNWATVRQDDAASTTLIITGLRPNVFYDVQVLALNGDGSGPWSATAESQTSPLPETVFANHPLVPDDLGPDDSFRLLFITEDTTDATDTGIEHYHDFAATRVIGLIEPGGLVSVWGAITLAQTALVSLAGADARLLTDTTWTPTDRGVPIYWLNGARVADDYADFYDGTWADEANPTNDIGEPHSLADPAPWTGTDHDGTELFDGAASRALGQATVGVGGPGSTAVGAGPLKGGTWFAKIEARPLYGLWHVMVIDENLRLVDNSNVLSRGDEDSDTRAAARAQLFTTGPHSSGYGIAYIQISNGSENDEFLGAVALHTTDTNGKPDLTDGLHATLILERTEGSSWFMTAPGGTVLKSTTTYALVFGGDAGSYPELWTIGADGESVAAEGWSIADALLYHDGTSWVENPNGRSQEMDIIGSRMETDGPALVSATVGTAGNAVTLAFDEDVALPSDSADALTFLASLASAFDLRADGESVAVSGLTASGTDGLTFGLSDVIVKGQAVTLTYTDPTAGDDAVALQDGLGNESPTFTTGVDDVPDVINNSNITVPSAPRNLVATASGTTQINLSWSVPASNGGFAITGYRIEVSPNGNSNWTELVANTGNPNTTFADTVAAGTTRHYRVLAINARGSSIPSGVANDTTNEEKTSSVNMSAPTEGEVTEEEVTEEEVEEGCAVSDVTDYQSLEIFVECAAERIEDSDTFTETLRILEGFRDGEGNWNDGSTYLVLLTARGGVYFHANDREVEDLDWSGILLCEEGEESVLDTQEGCFIEYEGARMGYAHPFSASHVPLARGEEEFVLLGDFDKIPEEGKPFTGMIGEPSTEAGEVDTDDQLKEFVGEAGRVLRETLEDEDSGIDPAELRGILRREGPWREGDVYLYIMSEMGRVIFDGAKRDREQKNEYAKQYVKNLISGADANVVEYIEDDFLIKGYTARVEVPLDAEEDSRVYFVGSGYWVEGQPGGSGCAVGGSGKGGAFGLFLAALTLLLAVLLKRRLADGKAR